MRRGIGRLRAGGSSGDADANAWAAAVTANGGTYSAATLAAVTAFTASAKASGYWTKLNRINLFCGNQLAAALVPLKGGGGSATETNNNFVGGDYTEATGLTGNGSTKYLDTGLIPSVSLTLNNTHLAVYNRAASAVGGNIHIGGQGGTATTTMALWVPFTDGKFYSDAYANSPELASAVISTPYGLAIGTVTDASTETIYKGGSSVASGSPQTGTLPTSAISVFAKNANGVLGSFTSHPLAAYSIGSGLTASDVTAYNTHMTTFQTALARNV